MSKKIAQSIDESLSKQQKEFFLRQQLAAIQRELRSLQRPPNSAPNFNGTTDPAAGDGRAPSAASELDDDEQAEAEDMADIRAKIEAMARDSEERRMAVREWRRLRRTPAGSVEHGVIRNYVRAIPPPFAFLLLSFSLTLCYVSRLHARCVLTHLLASITARVAYGGPVVLFRGCGPDGHCA